MKANDKISQMPSMHDFGSHSDKKSEGKISLDFTGKNMPQPEYLIPKTKFCVHFSRKQSNPGLKRHKNEALE